MLESTFLLATLLPGFILIILVMIFAMNEGQYHQFFVPAFAIIIMWIISVCIFSPSQGERLQNEYRETIENRPKCLDEHPDVDVRYLPASCIEKYASYFHDSLYDYYNLRHYELNRAKDMQEDRENIDEKLADLADDPD
jgi:hypothetical protein